MKFKIAGITMALIVVAAALGASAYTSGTVERSSNVQVVNDDQGLLALSDGTSGDLVSVNNSGMLEIDFTTDRGAQGVNPNSTYVLGNEADPTNQTAFNISNLDTVEHTITVSYENVVGATDDGADNVQFKIYDDTNTDTPITTVSEESPGTSLTAGPGHTYYVVIVVDTTNVASGTDLSGTLKVSA